MKNLLLMMMISLVALSACNNDDRVTAEIKALSGREIVFPKVYKSLSYHDSLDVEPLLKADLKMVSLVDYLPCTSCGVKMLYSWIAEIDSIEKGLPYVIVVQTENKKELMDIIAHEPFPRPLMFYETDVFKTENRLDVLARNKTFLLDRDNRIILVGEPFGRNRLIELYRPQVRNYRKNIRKKGNEIHSG